MQPRPIKTRRMHGIPLKASHEALYHELYGDPAIMVHIGPAMTRERSARAFQMSLEDQQSGRRLDWAMHDEYDVAFAICGLVETNPRIAQIGCLLKSDHHGKGYATELLAELVRVAFEDEGIQQLESISTVNNRASFVFMQKLGFTYSRIAAMPHGLGPGYRWCLRVDQWADEEGETT